MEDTISTISDPEEDLINLNITLSTIDMENLLGLVHDGICNCLSQVTKHMAASKDDNDPIALWYIERSEYLKELEEKVGTGLTRL